MKRVFILFTGLFMLFGVCNYFIKRENSFFIFIEGDLPDNNEQEITMSIDGSQIFIGDVGYYMLGTKRIDLDLKGGFHSVEISYGDNTLSHEFYVFFGETFRLAILDTKSEVSLDFNRHFLPFMFA